MNKELKSVFKISSLYICTIMGAGFASGQEIMKFFTVYYKGGFYGIILSGILFSFLGAIVFKRVYDERIKNYDEFLYPTVGVIFGRIMEVIVMFFLLALFCIMIAGSANVLKDMLEIPYLWSVIIMTIFCLFVILRDVKGIVFISSTVTPILISGITVVGLYVILTRDTSVFSSKEGIVQQLSDNWVISSLLYVSYNSIMAFVIMCTVLPYIRSARAAVRGGILGGMLLCGISLIINTLLTIFYPRVSASQLPIMSILDNYGPLIDFLYGCLLWIAMFTSAVTAGFCLIQRVSDKTGFNRSLTAIFISPLAVPLSFIGFASLISYLYPIFGYASLFMIFAVIIYWIRGFA